MREVKRWLFEGEGSHYFKMFLKHINNDTHLVLEKKKEVVWREPHNSFIMHTCSNFSHFNKPTKNPFLHFLQLPSHFSFPLHCEIPQKDCLIHCLQFPASCNFLTLTQWLHVIFVYMIPPNNSFCQLYQWLWHRSIGQFSLLTSFLNPPLGSM